MARCVEKHTAVIFDRGGKRRIGPLVDLSRVRWERTRDGVSVGSISVEGDACRAQESFLGDIRAHRHELVIFRGTDRVWEGPVERVTWYRDYVEIVAHDVLEYVMATPLTKKWSSAYPMTDQVTSRIGEIMEYELTTGRSQIAAGVVTPVPAWEAMDPPANVVPHIVIHHFPNEAKTTTVTTPFQMTVGEHLQSLGMYSGIDFTTVGRAIHVWDVSRALGRISQLTDENFLADPIVSEYGSEHAQAAYVVAQDGAYGSGLSAKDLEYYGPWTKVFTVYNEEGTREPTQGELNSQALRNLAGRTPAPVEVRIPDNTTVLLGDNIGINDLVCGVQIPVRATLNARKYSQMQKLDHLTVTETADEGEMIQITLVPTTKEDADEELPEPELRTSVPFPAASEYGYILDTTASSNGTSVLVKGTVRFGGTIPVQGAGLTWSVSVEVSPGVMKTVTGTWDYKFQFYKRKTVFAVTIENVAPGTRAVTATVRMGAPVGETSTTGFVEV